MNLKHPEQPKKQSEDNSDWPRTTNKLKRNIIPVFARTPNKNKNDLRLETKCEDNRLKQKQDHSETESIKNSRRPALQKVTASRQIHCYMISK